MAANIKDVAKLANVSISTVSRVMNHASNVSPDIANRVNSAIKELHYQPNIIARSLSGSPFRAIGVAASRSSNSEYIAQILSAIGTELNKRSYNMIVNFSQNDNEEVTQCLSMVEGRIAQGMILLGSKNQDPLIKKLHKEKIPFIVIGAVADPNLAPHVYTIDTDNRSDCQRAVNYLFSLNHKNIACLHSSRQYTVTAERINGFIDSHKDFGYEVNPEWIIDAGYTLQEAYIKSIYLLQKPNRPSAIFATDDNKALGCYKAAAELSLNIPDDLSIIGHNNYESSQITIPPLSTVNVPVTTLGERAVQILCDVIEGIPVNRRTILPTELILRGSCKYYNG